MEPKRALFVGRFQPFHNGHEHVVRELLEKYDEVIIVIGTAENPMTKQNPFTAGERMEMIRSCFSAQELSRMLIVPIRDVNSHSTWVMHVKSYLPHFEAVYSNNDLVRHLFKVAGIPAREIEFHNQAEHTGEVIRTKIRKGEEWENNVPKTVAALMKKYKIMERLASK